MYAKTRFGGARYSSHVELLARFGSGGRAAPRCQAAQRDCQISRNQLKITGFQRYRFQMAGLPRREDGEEQPCKFSGGLSLWGWANLGCRTSLGCFSVGGRRCFHRSVATVSRLEGQTVEQCLGLKVRGSNGGARLDGRLKP